MAPGGEILRYHQHFGENALRHGSHEWLPYSKNVVCTKSSNTNLSRRCVHLDLWDTLTVNCRKAVG